MSLFRKTLDWSDDCQEFAVGEVNSDSSHLLG